MNARQFLITAIVASFFGGFVAITSLKYYSQEIIPQYNSIAERQKVQFTNFSPDSNYIVPEGLNFVHAAAQVINGVVHIRSRYSATNDVFQSFRGRPSQSSGSGVIISDDGYIVTNNHVIDNASDVEVTLHDNRSYHAKIIGTDPSTDLALLKINERNLNFIKYGNSDNVKLGEWVLAVGNPFNLTSTVTAGIVSAKARNIGILARDNNGLQIESFIQTDAAVNPGNSGGALVNLNGELIGVNTAIATQTGSYQGYSFAVPVSLVMKIMNDLLEFGEVQRGLLGIIIVDVTARLAEQEGLDVVKGVYVAAVNENSAAEEAGIKTGDVITEIEGVKVDNVAELQEMVARNRPGDKVKVKFNRKGKVKEVDAVLRNTSGNTKLVTRSTSDDFEGASFRDLTSREKRELEIPGGAKITDIREGKWSLSGIKEGFVITAIDKVSVDNAEDVARILQNKAGGVLIEGIYDNGDQALYAMKW